MDVVNEEIDLDEVQTHLNEVKVTVDVYTKIIKDRMKERMERAKQQMKALEERRRGLEEKIEERRSDIQKYKNKLRSLPGESNREQIVTFQQNLIELSAQNSILREKIDKRKRIYEQKKSEIDSTRHDDIKELRACVQYSQLQIDPVRDDQIKFTFYSIDENAPDKPYYFILNISDDRFYTVIHCSHSIPNLSACVDELNKNRDLYGFIKQMRKLFCTVANRLLSY
ncbi:chromosome segregation protein Spc25-domain-containing protein [Pilobolus umbonatus]|nr:chromosome segregation protein Spc25-domain-containing protein [Pilobolus umbonatus]